MSALLHHHRWAIRPHLRPQCRRAITTAADIDPETLRRYPDVVAELNLCPADVWEGQGRPGRSWKDWSAAYIPLELAVSLPCRGEA